MFDSSAIVSFSAQGERVYAGFYVFVLQKN
jgi:hypothetical protein